MGNRSYPYEITWCWKEDGNRPDGIQEVSEVTSTTVGRAINKLARELHDELGSEEEPIKPSSILVIDVRSHKLTNAIIDAKKKTSEENAQENGSGS